MSDDTKALVEELRFAAKNTLIPWRPTAKDAADTIERLERDRDALAERCEKLRDRCERMRSALRSEALHRFRGGPRYCRYCSEMWEADSPERHAEGCLAA